MSILLMRLAGPMQAWGTQSRFSVRDTGLEPSKSGVIGLLCAALGKPREERPGDGFPALAEMANLTMGVRVDRPGSMARDYHTAKDVIIASSPPGRKPRLKDCEPSTRYYLADADFLVGLAGDDELIDRLDAALANPAWPLYLGRKAFVPSMPLRAGDEPVRDLSLDEALKSRPWWRRKPREVPDGPVRIVLEQPPGSEGEVRNDVPVSYRYMRRRFTVRRVRDAELWPVPEDLIQEWPPCNSTCRS